MARNDALPLKRSIAVVDDDASLGAAIGSLLRSAGYATEVFGSAGEFLDQDAHRCSCVIADIHMPGMSGLALTAQLHGSIPDLPVILITAHADPGLASRAAACGAAFVLEKPFTARQLLDSLDAVGMARS